MTYTSPITDDVTLQNYIVAILGGVANTLGLDISNVNAAGITYDVYLDYGVTGISGVTDQLKLRRIAKYHGWKLALTTVSVDYDFSDAGASFKRSQMFDQIKKQYELAKKEALPYLSDYAIQTDTFDWKNDPYEYHEAGTYLNPDR